MINPKAVMDSSFPDWAGQPANGRWQRAARSIETLRARTPRPAPNWRGPCQKGPAKATVSSGPSAPNPKFALSLRRPQSSQRPGRVLQQRPAFSAEPLLPFGVGRREPRAECRLVGVVEDEPASDERIAQVGIELSLIRALLAHVFGGVAFDHRLNAGWQPLPCRQMRHQIKTRPHVIGHADIFKQ